MTGYADASAGTDEEGFRAAFTRKRHSLFGRPESMSSFASNAAHPTAAKGLQGVLYHNTSEREPATSASDTKGAVEGRRRSFFGGRLGFGGGGKKELSRHHSNDDTPQLKLNRSARPHHLRGLSAPADLGQITEDDYYRNHTKSSISPPFNFQHVTHTRKKHLPALDTVSEKDLTREFWAASAHQNPRSRLQGIQAENLSTKAETMGLIRGSDNSRPATPVRMDTSKAIPHAIADPSARSSREDITALPGFIKAKKPITKSRREVGSLLGLSERSTSLPQDATQDSGKTRASSYAALLGVRDDSETKRRKEDIGSYLGFSALPAKQASEFFRPGRASEELRRLSGPVRDQKLEQTSKRDVSSLLGLREKSVSETSLSLGKSKREDVNALLGIREETSSHRDSKQKLTEERQDAIDALLGMPKRKTKNFEPMAPPAPPRPRRSDEDLKAQSSPQVPPDRPRRDSKDVQYLREMGFGQLLYRENSNESRNGQALRREISNESRPSQTLYRQNSTSSQQGQPMHRQSSNDSRIAQPMIRQNSIEARNAQPMLRRDSNEARNAQPMVRGDSNEARNAQPMVRGDSNDARNAQPMLRRDSNESRHTQPMLRQNSDEARKAQSMLRQSSNDSRQSPTTPTSSHTLLRGYESPRHASQERIPSYPSVSPVEDVTRAQQVHYRSRQPLPAIPRQNNNPEGRSPLQTVSEVGESYTPLRSPTDSALSPRSPASLHSSHRTIRSPELTGPSMPDDETWEHEIDLLYSKEAEATNEFDWDNVSETPQRLSVRDPDKRLSLNIPSETDVARLSKKLSEGSLRSSIYMPAALSVHPQSGSRGHASKHISPSDGYASAGGARATPDVRVMDADDHKSEGSYLAGTLQMHGYESIAAGYLSDPESNSERSHHRKSNSYSSCGSRPSVFKEPLRHSNASITNVPELSYTRRPKPPITSIPGYQSQYHETQVPHMSEYATFSRGPYAQQNETRPSSDDISLNRPANRSSHLRDVQPGAQETIASPYAQEQHAGWI